MQLEGKKILLAVTGSIAAYKTPDLVRKLIKAGAEVRVIATPQAADFVSILALSTVSKHPVHSNVSDGAAWNNHVELGRWADAMLIAPGSANTIAKLANGLCDNLVCAVYLSATCPVLIAPAMDEDMWHHPATAANLDRLKSFGNTIIPVAHGELASGLIGDGRMEEPENIITFLGKFFDESNDRPLAGLRALVTAGPTFEKIDPVRFIGNFSTGKMGISIAESLAGKGAEVVLVLGPSSQKVKSGRIEVRHVESAEEMLAACTSVFDGCDIAVMAAAVADYRPAERAVDKIKKTEAALSIALIKNPDILATLGEQKRDDQTLVGFALETTDEEANARGKLISKRADMLVLNSLRDEGAGFGGDTNKVTLFEKSGKLTRLALQSKNDVASAIVNKIIEYRNVVPQTA